MPGAATSIVRNFVQLFYPHLCEGCRRPLVAGEEVLCMGCFTELPETRFTGQPGNEAELRFSGRIPFTHATSLAYFTADGLLQHLLHGLKYRNRQETGLWLGRLLGERIKQAGWGREVDLVVPVPLHRRKLAKRGYNQSLLIGQGMASVIGKPCSDKLMKRVRNTDSQTNKTRLERVQNMADAFAVPLVDAVTNRHILLCDDVLTTGATLEACSLALMGAGNIKISIATIGIAVS